MRFQGDRNLVIYDSNNNALFASNTSTSDRDKKENIVELEQNESIDRQPSQNQKSQIAMKQLHQRLVEWLTHCKKPIAIRQRVSWIQYMGGD